MSTDIHGHSDVLGPYQQRLSAYVTGCSVFAAIIVFMFRLRFTGCAVCVTGCSVFAAIMVVMFRLRFMGGAVCVTGCSVFAAIMVVMISQRTASCVNSQAVRFYMNYVECDVRCGYAEAAHTKRVSA